MEEERKDESPASWRLGLRKTGSYGALAEITATKEAQREKDTTGVMRSASSPRLSSSLDNKDKDKVSSQVILSQISHVGTLANNKVDFLFYDDRKRKKERGLPTSPPQSLGDWPVLQTLTRRKTGKARGQMCPLQTCIGMSAPCCPLLCVADKRCQCSAWCVASSSCCRYVLCCAAVELTNRGITFKRRIT